MRLFLALMIVMTTGCHHQTRGVLVSHRCETVNLSRDEVATIRIGQERSRADIARLQADLAACSKARLVEQERERRLREDLAKARDHTPWMVVVVVVAVAGIAGVIGVAVTR